jgi:hypothetical protein
MKFSRSLAASAVGLMGLATASLPSLASADLFDYQYCVQYSSPTYGDCRSQGYVPHQYPYVYPAGSTQNGAYYGGGYSTQYQQPSYYYPQQYYYPQTYYYPTYYYPDTYYYGNAMVGAAATVGFYAGGMYDDPGYYGGYGYY